MISLLDPTSPGQFNFERIVYAVPGLNYLKTPDLHNHCIFEHPTPQYETESIDLTQILNFEYEEDFPFDKKKTPINGILCVPKDKISLPFPVAIFVHGNFPNFKMISAPGALYLCDLLASHGILAATIDASFLTSLQGEETGQFGEIAGRAILVLEHLKQFQRWNQQKWHFLQGKINLDKCTIVGHSFGGEAVGHASFLNQQKSPIQFYRNAEPVVLDGSQGLGPYGFGIEAVIALAPTDRLYCFPKRKTKIPDNYLIIHGSQDQSVARFPGQFTYDFSHPVKSNDFTPSGFKSLLWIYKANHNHFNSLWEADDLNTETIEREEQERITKVYVSALAQAMLQNKKDYLQLLQNHQFGIERGWLSRNITYISQYQSPYRLLIQHFEESDCFPHIAAPVEGKVSYQGISIQVQSFFCKNIKEPDRKYHLYQSKRGLRIDWTEMGGRYILTLNPTSLNADKFEFLSFRVGQSFENNNVPQQAQNFTIIVHNETQSFSLPVSQLQSLPYPDSVPRRLAMEEAGNQPITVLQTVFLSLEQLRLRGFNSNRLTQVEFVFDITPSGTIYISDIQLTR